MKIRISIDKVEALKAGKDKYGPIVVDVPAESLTLEQRIELAEYTACRSQEQPQADFYLDTHRSPTQGISEGSPDAVRLILDRLIEIRRTDEAKKAEEKAKKIADFRKRFSEDPRKAAISWTAYREVEPAKLLEEIPELSDALQWAKSECNKIEQEQAIAKIKNQEQEEKKKELERKRLAEIKAQKEADENVLREWAEANGSDLLKARIADKFEWIGMAEKEFTASVVVELGEEIDIPDHEKNEELERTTPTLPEIQRLREVRKLLEEKPARCELIWATYDNEIKRAELKVTVTTPTDRDVDFYYPATEK